MNRLLPALFFLLCLISAGHAQPKPSYVWIDETGEGRQVYAYFRNEFDLTTVPETAIINLYAFSRYLLVVNGQFVNFGPIRSYPQHPYYDSIDMAPYLKKGKNVVAVKALNNGMETFQLPYGKAAFIAWGELKSGEKTIDLQTPGNWISRKAEGYHPLSPRFSFAKGPIEVFDARLEPDDWQAETIAGNQWRKSDILKNQEIFGSLIPRSIPLLTNDEILPKFTVARLNLKTNEQLYIWNALNADQMHSGYGDNPAVLMYTNIYSPEAKEVSFGLSWGNFWMNDQKVVTVPDTRKPFRNNATVKLKKGWNSFFASQTILWGTLDGMLAVPKNAGIELSVNRKLNDPVRIRMAGPLTKEQEKLNGGPNVCPANPEKLAVCWNDLSGKEAFANPPKEIAWRDTEKIKADPYQRENFLIQANQDQALVFDLGGIQLGRIFIDADAPEGTIFDLTFSEDLKDSLVTLYKRTQINAGARFISKSGKQHFETYKPYGLRYLQVSVRNHVQPVRLFKAGVYSQIYPYEKKGSFVCSDPLLNDIWEMGWRTIRACSEDSYDDTPFRERGHYAGDLYPELAVTLATSGDPRLAKHTIRVITDMYEKTYTHEAETRHADYPLINLLVASWYIRQLGDREFARELYPIFDPYIKTWYSKRGTDGLYKPERVFFEWIPIDKNAALTSFQTVMFAAFQEMSFMAKLLGKTSDANQYDAWATETKDYIRKNLWDAKTGNFIDGMKDGAVLPTRFPGSSTFPSVWKIPSAEQEKSLQNWFQEALINIGPPVNRTQLSTPYGGFYALASLYQQENAALAEQYIRKHWGKMVLEANDLTWEDFNRDAHSTMSHAWSSSPTFYLSTQVLGVDLGFPGNLSPDTIYIRPQSETLSWAKGTVPHPKGLVSVNWKIHGRQLVLNYSVPEGIPVVVEPRGRLRMLNLIVNK